MGIPQVQPQIAIVGAGAIGMLIYHQLASVTQPLLLGRSFGLPIKHNHTSQHQTNPQQIMSLTVDANSANTETTEALSSESTSKNSLVQPCLVNNLSSVSAEQLTSLKLVIVCVKSYQVATALTGLIDKLPPNTNLLLLHNGMGPHLQVLALLAQAQRPDISLYLGTTSQAALKVAELHVRQTGTGNTVFGHIHGSVMNSDLTHLLLAAIPNSQMSDNILNSLWQKLIVNCAINPLTTIEQCNNGQLAQPQYQSQIHAIASECVTVASADGIQLSLTDSLSTINKVIALTANNFSSMHQDVKHKRKTEIEQINGFVAAQARHHGINVPQNDAMTAKITKLTQR